MKFSEIERGRWPELKPFMDTCLLPVTGLTGEESPWEAAEALERLRDAMDELEKRYVGRLVTYPAFHYTEGGHLKEQLQKLILSLKEKVGFVYVVIITADPKVSLMERPEAADLMLNALHVQSRQAVTMISALWQPQEKVEN